MMAGCEWQGGSPMQPGFGFNLKRFGASRAVMATGHG